LAFLKKELMESTRTYKVFLMLVIFAVFGMMSPLIAKLTPQLIGSVVSAQMASAIPTPTAVDSWTQFYKNVAQMGLVILVIVFSGVLANELTKGTLVNVVTKGLSRALVIAAKLTSMALIWTVSLALAFAMAWIYTSYLFGADELPHLGVAVLLLWIFGLFVLSLLMCAASLSTNNYMILLITGAVLVIGLLAGILPPAYHYNPLSLASQNMPLITGAITLSDIGPAIAITVALTAGLVTGAILIFRRRLL
jgi:ABC-2 type transport system permease protein